MRHLKHGSKTRLLAALMCAAAAALWLAPSAASAAEGWAHWWLPPDYSKHGHAIDALFNWTFGITMVTFILVEGCLIVFLIKYRSRPGRHKAHFTHGNTRLEMAWTIAPAIILAALAVANKGVWDRIRFNPDANSPDLARVLVIGQQFKWNIIYAGPDGQLGRYLIYPKPTDVKWPHGKKFRGVDGPASLAYDESIKAINAFIDLENPLGKDFNDPAGKDDDWVKQPGREMAIPVNRPVEVQLGSKDVIHDFFLPNFRVKLDALPGVRGAIVFTATRTSKQTEQESRDDVTIDQLIAQFQANPKAELSIAIDAKTPKAVKDPKKDEYLFQDQSDPTKPKTIIRNSQPLTPARAEQLKAAGIEQVTVYQPGYFDIVCEELCGEGHSTMQARLVVLEQDEYRRLYETPKGKVASAE